MLKNYDIIVVGGGHAGSEAAAAAARLGSEVLLITHSLANIAQMSCNPSIGGVGKGQIVREIDALGGLTAKVTDQTMIQFRMLNHSKGPAMWSPRAQCDRFLFSSVWRNKLENIPTLDFWQDDVIGLLTQNQQVCGVETRLGVQIKSKAVVLTNGTFLNGLIHIGTKQMGGGRIGEPPSKGLTENLIQLGFESARMKTGTPVRIDGRSVHFSELIEQPGDENPQGFSFSAQHRLTEQRSCFLAYTNSEVHQILESAFHLSPLFTGVIKGVGPRYCPSIEDKIVRFSDKDHHQLFLEPEGWNTIEYYLNGFSSSLPEDIQYAALKKIKGFEEVKILRPGYAIEYDYFPPVQLQYSLETKNISHLFFAGQINGTTGYEEAAAQGLMAGINAHRKINDAPALILKRDQAYIGVMIDDLICKGVDEPYRMFTSRAEHRILLRQDNANLRLMETGHSIGLIENSDYERFLHYKSRVENLYQFIKTQTVDPKELNAFLETLNEPGIHQKVKLEQMVLRPAVSLKNLSEACQSIRNYFEEFDFTPEEIQQAETLIKYESYILKEKEMALRIQSHEEITIHPDFNYSTLQSLSMEAREKLSRIKPLSLGQASRISGITPSDIAVLMIYLRK